MKYRYTTQIMTRHSGMLTIFCEDREQASRNVDHYLEWLHRDRVKYLTISFDSVCNSLNTILMNEIIGVSVGDNEMLLDIHREEILEHRKMEQDIDFSLNKGDE